ncbi:Lactonase, 7-bladed beta-propeller [Chitinophaga japonensis]|uniref:Lactonase, 7-bladed beta-propeller n=2 Tax=Chitinophaga japonensis TaxID=104662 RepID=A0A562SYV9_CHIJA|nr:Lactonase, 7-bladed beta-propeller [Chitinophaga japonensis]
MALVALLLSIAAAPVFSQQADLLVINKIKTNGNLPGSIALVNLASGRIIKTIPVGNEPHEAAVSNDGKYALITNTGSYKEPSNTLSLIDVVAQEELERIDLGPLWNPHGVIYSHGLFYFTAEGARAIGAYDPEKRKLVWLNGTGQDQTHMLAATKDGKFLVSVNRGAGTVSVFERKGTDPLSAGAWKETFVKVGRAPEGIALSPDETKAFIGCDGEVAIVDLNSKIKADSIATGKLRAARLKFTLDGKYALGTDGRQGMLFFIDAATQQVTNTLKLGAGTEAIFIEPDGKHVLVGVTNEDNVAEVDIEKKEVVRRLTGFKGPDGMGWIGE